jgi:hypothetical protein
VGGRRCLSDPEKSAARRKAEPGEREKLSPAHRLSAADVAHRGLPLLSEPLRRKASRLDHNPSSAVRRVERGEFSGDFVRNDLISDVIFDFELSIGSSFGVRIIQSVGLEQLNPHAQRMCGASGFSRNWKRAPMQNPSDRAGREVSGRAQRIVFAS